MAITEEVLSELLKDYKSPEDLLGETGIFRELKKRLLERAMGAELTEHLGYEKSSKEGKGSGNSRNGSYKKTLKGEDGEVKLEVPRDRESEFEPQIVPKGQRRFDGFDEAITSLYARGLSTREIQGHLKEIYAVEVSPTLISRVTDEVIEELKAWQSRRLEEVYPIVYMDALVGKVRKDGQVQKISIYLALGITLGGKKDLLGMWTADTEGAKFWLSVLTELKNRGLEDIFIACVDGLKGFPQAIEAVYPPTKVQLCIVHMVRHSLRYVIWKKRKEVAADLRAIYQAATVEEAEEYLEAFATKWDKEYPTISASWRRNWGELITIFDYPREIRKAISTTNSIESLNAGSVK